MGGLAGRKFTVVNPLLAEDCLATLRGLEALGVRSTIEEARVFLRGGPLSTPSKTIDAANSGTTLRLLTGLAALLPGPTRLSGDASLRRRPMGALLEALQQLGARCKAEGPDGRPPVVIWGPMAGERASLPGDISSQFLSSLLIACPLKSTATKLVLTSPLKSEPYVAITLAMLREFGIAVHSQARQYTLPGGQRYEGTRYEIPGDYSSASFPLVAGAIAGGPVTVTGLDPHSLQGDAQLLGVLRQAGANVRVGEREITVSGRKLRGIRADVSNSPDLFPILAVLGACAQGRTTLTGGEHLRLKESDRIETTTRLLRRLGASVVERPDGCVVEGGRPLHGATVESEGDHRIVMAAAVAGLAARGPVRISDPHAYAVSYPNFVKDLQALGAAVEEGAT